MTAGFDQIKTYSSIAPDVLRAITSEAHKFGMTVTGHVPDRMNALDAIDAGLDQISHARVHQRRRCAADPPAVGRGAQAAQNRRRSDARAVRAAGQAVHGVHRRFEPGIRKVAPELATPLNGFGSPPDVRRLVSGRGSTAVSTLVARLHRAGVPIVAGTDQSVPGHSLHRELELYVKAGLSPFDALAAATIVPARAMKKDADSGTIEKGKRGDLILLDGNPLDDIRNTRRIHRVITNGRVFDPAPLWRSVGFQP